MDLLFLSSRAFGYFLRRHSSEEILAVKDAIYTLEGQVYEAERQDDPLQMAEEANMRRPSFWPHGPHAWTLKGRLWYLCDLPSWSLYPLTYD